jgi:recombinational DNA repair protein RecR
MQKFSSNVIEKCLDRVDDEILLMYVESLSDPETIKSLSKSNYGFYVIQKLINVCSHLEGVKEKISEELEKYTN